MNKRKTKKQIKLGNTYIPTLSHKQQLINRGDLVGVKYTPTPKIKVSWKNQPNTRRVRTRRDNK